MNLPDSMKDNVRYFAPALDKGLDIIELLAKAGNGLTQIDIGRRLGRSQGEIYRMLSTLTRRGYVVKMHNDGKYQLSQKLLLLSKYHVSNKSFFSQAIQPLQTAASELRQSCHICVEQDGQIIIVARADPEAESWSFSYEVGALLGLFNTAVGSVIAAFCSSDRFHRLCDRHVLLRGETNACPKSFEKRLTEVRRRGYEIMPNQSLSGITDIVFPFMGFDAEAVGVLYVPYLTLTDHYRDREPDRDQSVKILAATAARLQMVQNGVF